LADIDSRLFREVMGQFATGVVVATGCHDGMPYGFAVQSFVSLSIEPPLVALCPAKSSTSWPRIRDSGSFCINILRDNQQELCDAFARSGGNKFADFEWRTGASGSPLLKGVLAHVDCELEVEHDAGDHTIAIGRIVDLTSNGDGKPLIFYKGGFGKIIHS
jgi:flavin reductase (DIM6/NTAB) family NADH-FMN oxidoreductase RutF